MANSSGQLYGGGFRVGYVYKLNANNRIAGNSSSIPYMGVALSGVKSFALTEPKQRVLNHINADRVGAADFLPPLSIAEAALGASADDQQMDALITATTQTFIGEAAVLGHLTSNQGYEPIVAFLVCQQAEEYTTRARVWHSYVGNKCKIIPHSAQYGDKEMDRTFDLVFIPTNQNIMGTAYTIVANGYTDAQYDDWMTQGLPAIAAWQGDGYTTTFTFPTGFTPAVSASKVVVCINGVVTSAGVSATVTGVTITPAPAALADITIKWEI